MRRRGIRPHALQLLAPTLKSVYSKEDTSWMRVPFMYIAPSRFPETYWQLLTRSFTLYRRTLPHVFVLSLLLSLTVFIPRLISLMLGHDPFVTVSILSLPRLWLTLLDILSLFIFAAILWRINSFIREGHEPILDDLKVGLHKIPYIFTAALFQVVLATLLAYCLFFILLQDVTLTQQEILSYDPTLITIVFLVQFAMAVYLAVLFYFYLAIIVLENKGIIASLEKSAILVWKNGWRTFSLQITPWLFYLLILVILKFIFHAPIHIYYTEGEYSLFGTGMNLLLFAFFQPWVASVLLVQLRDLELRKKLTNSI